MPETEPRTLQQIVEQYPPKTETATNITEEGRTVTTRVFESQISRDEEGRIVYRVPLSTKIISEEKVEKPRGKAQPTEE